VIPSPSSVVRCADQRRLVVDRVVFFCFSGSRGGIAPRVGHVGERWIGLHGDARVARRAGPTSASSRPFDDRAVGSARPCSIPRSSKLVGLFCVGRALSRDGRLGERGAEQPAPGRAMGGAIMIAAASGSSLIEKPAPPEARPAGAGGGRAKPPADSGSPPRCRAIPRLWHGCGPCVGPSERRRSPAGRRGKRLRHLSSAGGGARKLRAGA